MKTGKKTYSVPQLYCGEGQGRGSNLTQEDRRRGGEHSHRGSSNQGKGQTQNRGSNMSQENRRRGGEGSSGRNS